MSGEEAAVADFVGRFARNPKNGIGEEPNTGRIVMSKKRLVVAADDNKRITVPLSNVVDVVVGKVPPNLRDLFDSTITIGYQTDDAVETILIEGGEETIGSFRTVLFKSMLKDTRAEVKHPARVGGRVTDSSVRKAKLSIGSERVTCRTKKGSFGIDITNVIGFDRTERAPDGTSRPTLLVRHADNGDAVTSLISPLSKRRLNLLDRFLRTEHGTVLEEVADIDLTAAEKCLLVTTSDTDDDIDFASVLDGDPARATNIANRLVEKGLLEDGPDGIALTARGQVVVTQQLDDGNV
jgi:helix-turn-helix protein